MQRQKQAKAASSQSDEAKSPDCDNTNNNATPLPESKVLGVVTSYCFTPQSQQKDSEGDNSSEGSACMHQSYKFLPQMNSNSNVYFVLSLTAIEDSGESEEPLTPEVRASEADGDGRACERKRTTFI